MSIEDQMEEHFSLRNIEEPTGKSQDDIVTAAL
jgi:hypothetical protein